MAGRRRRSRASTRVRRDSNRLIMLIVAIALALTLTGWGPAALGLTGNGQHGPQQQGPDLKPPSYLFRPAGDEGSGP